MWSFEIAHHISYAIFVGGTISYKDLLPVSPKVTKKGCERPGLVSISKGSNA